MIGYEEIRALAEETGFPRVSIYMPTHRAGPALRQGPIRLKNLLREAAHGLEERGMTALHIDDLFAEVRVHTESEAQPFWEHQDHGLAIFISPAGTRYINVPVHFEERVHAGSRFLVKPLLPVLMRDGMFFVLAVSQDGPILYRAGRFGMSAIDDDRLPRSAAPFTEGTQYTNAVGWHSASRGGGNVQFHGLGASPQDEMVEQVEQYAIAVAKAADAILGGLHAPLVIAADDRMLGYLRRSIRYKDVAEGSIREHPTAMNEEELHAKAYDLVRDRLEAERRSAMERFEARRNDASGNGVATRIEDVVPAALQGRVESLVVAVDTTVEGLVDLEQNRVVVAQAPTDETTDLIDYAILQTLAHGGAVYSRPEDRAGDFPSIGAVYRY